MRCGVDWHKFRPLEGALAGGHLAGRKYRKQGEEGNVSSDVFISYCHADNKPSPHHPRGWIDDFDDYLLIEIQQRGLYFKPWRDKRQIRPEDSFDQTIAEAIDASKVFLAVLSHHYRNSTYCRAELQRFLTNGANKEAIIKILKYPVRDEELDNELAILQRKDGLQFFQPERENDTGHDTARDYWHPLKGPTEEFWDVIQEVVAAIVRKMPKADSSQTVASGSLVHPLLAVPNPKALPVTAQSDRKLGPTIFLAEPSADLRQEYRSIRGELEARLGARIVPNGELPREEEAAIREINTALEQARWSVQLLGRGYGYVPEGVSGNSIVGLQLELTRRAGLARPDFERLIWMRPDRSAVDPRLLALIEDLKGMATTEATQLVSDHIVEEPLESFKRHLLDVVQRDRSRLLSHDRKPTRPPVLLIMCDAVDEAIALELRTVLRRRERLDVRVPEFIGTAQERAKACLVHIQQADAVLVIYGAASETWVLQQLYELFDWEALGRKIDFKARAVLLAGDLTSPRKQEFASPYADWYDHADIESFVHQLKKELSL